MIGYCNPQLGQCEEEEEVNAGRCSAVAAGLADVDNSAWAIIQSLLAKLVAQVKALQVQHERMLMKL